MERREAVGLTAVAIAAGWFATGVLLLRIAAAKVLEGVLHALLQHPLETVGGGLVGVGSLVFAAYLLIRPNRTSYAVSALVGTIVTVDCVVVLVAGHESAAVAIVFATIATGFSALAWRSSPA